MVITAMKKPLAGLVYFAGTFLALGLAGALGFATGAFLAGAGLASATGVVATTGSGLASTTGSGLTSTLYGTSTASTAFGVPRKNSLIFVNIMFSYAFIY